MANVNKINVGGVDYDIGGTVGKRYNSYQDAMDDIDNIEEGTLVITPDPEPTIQDIIDGMTALHLAG